MFEIEKFDFPDCGIFTGPAENSVKQLAPFKSLSREIAAVLSVILQGLGEIAFNPRHSYKFAGLSEEIETRHSPGNYPDSPKIIFESQDINSNHGFRWSNAARRLRRSGYLSYWQPADHLNYVRGLKSDR